MGGGEVGGGDFGGEGEVVDGPRHAYEELGWTVEHCILVAY